MEVTVSGCSAAPLGGEDDWVVLSALQHYAYCPRQCALIHLEQVFDENLFTLRGRRAHERVETEEPSTEGGVRVERSLPVWSERLRIRGKADVVEFHPDGTVYPVEYKHGPRRGAIHDAVQLCGQALCLDEMYHCEVARGAIYSYSRRRRREIILDAALRELTMETVAQVRALLSQTTLPVPPNDARCPKCSLIDACMPGAVGELSRGTTSSPFAPLPESGELP